VSMIRKLIFVWILALVGSLLSPLVSLAVVSGTTYEMQSTATTASVTSTEHTTAIEILGYAETDRRSMVKNQACSLLGLSINLNAPKSGSLFHYTSDSAANSILKKGINPGKDGFLYLTPKGKLSPLQAQIELALPANRQLPNALLKIDVNGLRKAGINPVFDQTTEGVFHGHTRTWNELTDQMQRTLRQSGMVNGKGVIH